MINWEEKLNTFLADFEHIRDVIGILVCGSYITGSPSSHSDLDVHLIFENTVGYRERGNRIVGGLLIEYFGNPPRQILKYFHDNWDDKSLMSQTQFATGKILLDRIGEVGALKEKAVKMIDDFYSNGAVTISEAVKYSLWDMLDDLQDAYENKKQGFDFLYFNLLNRLIASYMRCVNRPYNFKTILGNITDDTVRKKYLLKELPDKNISDLIAECINAPDPYIKMRSYQRLTDTVIERFGGFDIDKYTLKSETEV